MASASSSPACEMEQVQLSPSAPRDMEQAPPSVREKMVRSRSPSSEGNDRPTEKKARTENDDDNGQSSGDESTDSHSGAGDSTEEHRWKVTFPQCQMLRAFCNNVGSILTECYFEVVCSEEEEGFSGLSVESIDQGRVCLVQARLSGQVVLGRKETGNDEATTADSDTPGFCVRMTNLTSSLRVGSACHFVDLWQPAKSSDVAFRIYEPDVSTSGSHQFTLKTLAKDNTCAGLSGMEYSLFVEIDMETLRGPIRMAKEHKADQICFGVYTPKNKRKSKHNRSGAPPAPLLSFFVISYDADEVSAKFPYPSVSEPEALVDGRPTVIRANDASRLDLKEGLPPKKDLDTIYCDYFGVEHLFHFVQGMEKKELTLRLDTGKPLLLEYPMGGSSRSDYIRFVLAPKVQS